MFWPFQWYLTIIYWNFTGPSASLKLILLALHLFHWSRASGPPLISNPVSTHKLIYALTPLIIMLTIYYQYYIDTHENILLWGRIAWSLYMLARNFILLLNILSNLTSSIILFLFNKLFLYDTFSVHLCSRFFFW